MDFSKVLIADEIGFYMDASGAKDLGFGCFFDGNWTNAMWPTNFIDMYNPSIEYCELYAMTVAIVLGAHKLQNRRVVVFL